MIITKYSDNIIVASSNSPHVLGMAFVRIQEFYEGPEHRDRYFTLKEYKEWYKKTRGKKTFTYCKDWTGFNVPGNVVLNFNEKFKRKSKSEKNLLEKCLDIDGDFCLLGHRMGSYKVLKHELSHALWYLFPEYKEAMIENINKILDSSHIDSLKDNLKRLGYSDNVFIDEIHAYLLSDLNTHIKNWGVNLDISQTQDMRQIYNNYISNKLTVDSTLKSILSY